MNQIETNILKITRVSGFQKSKTNSILLSRIYGISHPEKAVYWNEDKTSSVHLLCEDKTSSVHLQWGVFQGSFIDSYPESQNVTEKFWLFKDPQRCSVLSYTEVSSRGSFAIIFSRKMMSILHLQSEIVWNHFLSFFFFLWCKFVTSSYGKILKGSERANCFLKRKFPYLVLQYFIIVPLKLEFSIKQQVCYCGGNIKSGPFSAFSFPEGSERLVWSEW